jgi:hypothetical protein
MELGSGWSIAMTVSLLTCVASSHAFFSEYSFHVVASLRSKAGQLAIGLECWSLQDCDALLLIVLILSLVR